MKKKPPPTSIDQLKTTTGAYLPHIKVKVIRSKRSKMKRNDRKQHVSVVQTFPTDHSQQESEEEKEEVKPADEYDMSQPRLSLAQVKKPMLRSRNTLKYNHSEKNLSRPANKSVKKDYTNFLQFDFLQGGSGGTGNTSDVHITNKSVVTTTVK